MANSFTIMLLITIIFGMDFATAGQQQLYSYGHWQCSLPQNKSLFEAAGEYIQSLFLPIGYKHWMMEKRKYISCHQRGLKRVPQGLHEQVQILDLRRNSITHVKNNDFLEYKQLEAVLLQQNCFTANIYRLQIPSCAHNFIDIEPLAFAAISQLNYLDLSDNKIASVPQNLPRSLKFLGIGLAELGQLQVGDSKNLTNLEIAILGNNCIQGSMSNLCKRNFSIDNFKFFSDNLLYLDFSYDSLKAVPKWLFSQTLIGINLQGNPIHVVNSGDFTGSPQIRSLILSWTSKHDKIPLTIMNGAFDSLSQLEYIDLSGNMLSTIPDFTSHSMLSSIGLDFNCLTKSANDPTNLWSLPLTKLEMFGNTFCTNNSYPTKARIPTFTLGEAFGSFSKLQTLKFEGFSSISTPTVQEMYWIFSYGYLYDYINEKSLQVLQHLPNLKKLSLTFSGIRSIDMSMFCKFNLTLLDLGVNEIKYLSAITTIHNKIAQNRTKRQSESSHDHTFLKKDLTHFQQFYEEYIEKMKNQYSNVLILHRNALTNLANDAFKCFSKTTYLDLSYNRISYIPSNTFTSMTHLEKLNLQFNPVRQIYPGSQNGLSKLNTLMLNYTAFQGEFTLKFLLNATSEIKLNYGDVTDNIYRLLSAYRKNSTTFQSVVSITFVDIPIPIYDVLNNEPFFSPFPNLRDFKLINAEISAKLGNKFFYGVSNVTKVALRGCKLRQFPYEAIGTLPKLRHLDLSYNYFDAINKSWFDNIANLTSLKISYNFITYIAPHTFHSLVEKGLKELDLRNNLISDVTELIIDSYAMSNLLFLDLRQNPIVCDCSLTRNFGQLIFTETSKQLHIPGFLPVCSAAVDSFYGGCLTCSSVIGRFNCQPPSLFLYSLSNICAQEFLITLFFSFSIFIVVFILLALICNSETLKRRLMKSWLETNLGQFTEAKASTNSASSSLYVYDAFVVYDTNDSMLGDWVDFTMVPKLESGFPSFKIGVVEKEDWSGLISEVQQLLLRMEASSKTIVLLSNQFAQSVKCRYVLGVLQQWVYTKGEDRCIIVTFQKHCPSEKGFKWRQCRNRWSVLNISNLIANDTLFFELLRNAIASKR